MSVPFEAPAPETRKRALWHGIRRTFLTGVVILIPLYVTYVLVTFLFNMLTGVAEPVVEGLFRLVGLDETVWARPLEPLVKLVLSLLAVLVLGVIGTNLLGRRLLEAIERLLLRLPVVSGIYGSAKQMVDTFRHSGQNFQRVVLVEYPSKGYWVMGFVAAERQDRIKLTASDRLLAVFIPTTPNPTSGFLILVEPNSVIELAYSVEDAFKFVVSSGIVGRDLMTAARVRREAVARRYTAERNAPDPSEPGGKPHP